MSAGGFIAQAMLGGTAGAAKGIGERLREEAKLKRQQALDDTRNQNAMQRDTHKSALNIGEQNLQNEFAAGQAEETRRHQTTQAETEHDRRKDLVDYRINAETEADKASGKYEIDPRVKIQIDEVQGRLDHLRKLETNLRTKSTDSFGGAIGGSTEEGGLTWEEINARRNSATKELNKLLGISEPTPTDNSLLALAMQTPAEERGEFLDSLKNEKRASPQVVKAIETLFASDRQAAEQPQGQPQPTPQNQPQSQPEPKPEGGLMTQAEQASTPPPQSSQPAPQPTTDERPGANPRPKRNPNEGKSMMEKQLGPALESGVKAAGDWYKGAMAEQRNERRSTLIQMAEGADPFNGNRQALLQFLKFAQNEVKDLTPEQIDSLKARLGDDVASRYLPEN